MNHSTFLKGARDLISDARLEEAIEQTEKYLEVDRKFSRLSKEAIRISSQFNKTKQDELKGTISFENAKLSYGQVTDALLHLLEYIENKDYDPETLQPSASKSPIKISSKKWLLIAGLPTLTLSIIVLVLIFRSPNQESPEEIINELECSAFEPDAFPKIIILPFFHPVGEELGTQGLIAERLEDFSQKLKLKSDVELCRGFIPEKLLNYDEAEDLGRKNKSDLIIWGRAEKAGNEIAVKTRFRYLGDRDTIPFTNLKWQGETKIDTIKVLSIITSKGELTSDVEATILLVLGLVADQAGDYEKAKMALEEANVSDSTGILIKNMLLAEYLQKLNDDEGAIKAYDKLLSVHPNYWLAENNRGVLRASQKDYLGAIEDFSHVIEKRPKDAELYLMRARAFQQSEQLIPALRDLEKFLELEPDRKDVKEQMTRTKAEISKLENKVERLKSKETRQNLNKQDIQEIRNASRRLGQNEEAKKWAEKGLSFDPNSPENIAIYIELKLKNGDKGSAKEDFESALSKGIEKSEILKFSPLVKQFVENEINLIGIDE